MNDLRAYECMIEDVEYYESVYDGYGGHLGSIHQSDDFYGIYYATSPSKAKHLFIKENNHNYDLGLEYTSPIKVRLLAKNVVGIFEYTGFDEDIKADWENADLTARGREIVAEWEKVRAYLAEDVVQE